MDSKYNFFVKKECQIESIGPQNTKKKSNNTLSSLGELASSSWSTSFNRKCKKLVLNTSDTLVIKTVSYNYKNS